MSVVLLLSPVELRDCFKVSKYSCCEDAKTCASMSLSSQSVNPANVLILVSYFMLHLFYGAVHESRDAKIGFSTHPIMKLSPIPFTLKNMKNNVSTDTHPPLFASQDL